MATTRAPAREIFGWAMFDFANSSYTTVICTVVYAIVFPKVIVGDAPDYALGNLLWSVALSVSYALVVFSAPIVGAFMDVTGHKKRYLLASWLLTVGTTALLGLAGPGQVALAMLLVIVSNYGFAIGESFVASFLSDLGPPEMLGKISGLAWGLGYFGGLVSTAIVLFGLGEQTPENAAALRWVGPITAVFFFFAALPTFAFLRDHGVPRPLPAGTSPWTAGFTGLARTARELGRFWDLALFFASFFFAMAGIAIVVSFAFIYGDQVIHWTPLTQTLMFVLTQLSAAGGAIAFGWLQGRLGDQRTYSLTLGVWVATVFLIWGTDPLARGLSSLFGREIPAEWVFLLVAVFAGACLGATQSAARTLVALFAPLNRVGEFFGFWGVFGKLAAIVGLVSLGALQAMLDLRSAILLCAGFFFVAMVIAWFVDEKRGRRAAMETAASP